MEERKVNDSSRWHNLTCKPPTVIRIYNAWDYIDDCWKYFTDIDVNGLKKKCNGKFSCSYIRSRKWRTCHSRYLSLTKSVIQYYCVRYYSETTTSVTILPSSESTKVTAFTESNTQYRKYTTSNQHSTSIGRMNTNTPVTSTNTRSTLQEHSSTSNDAVIAGSVIGVLGALALILLLICFVLKRRKADKHEATTSATGNSIVLRGVQPQSTSNESTTYSTLENIPDQNHIYGTLGSRQQNTNCFNNIHGTDDRNSPPTAL
ncbi:hypothetical protein LOTGIDRAFT_155347 [Lottia gigantea]|uniref:Mid2 domain-containing protein n=1 Tax=Lottia gigantea TaxID=225164 RepID=V3ZT08_LOTGI|nr:hypothetical protein LOTGIDRAFT_155347 [Lottia gigantea]ESO84031.1 hypothetical protein LOTGIDRAFT_155347 [Lottia gigantea]